METPQPSDTGEDAVTEDSTAQRSGTAREAAPPARPELVSTTSHCPPATSLNPQEASPAELPDEKAETVIRRSEGGSSVRIANRSGPATPAEVAGVLLGSRLSHFHLEEMIGGGGMGAVFRARDERLDRIVAIKVIPFAGDDPEMQRRFRNEAQSAARLDHPNIARVFDVGMFEGWRYIVFEHIEGTNIRDLVARDGVLSIDDAVFYTRQIAEALHHASGRGVVHRDVKPSNILVSPDGNTKLVDMGLARSDQLDMTGDMTASGVTLGTFDYISPEQARDPRDADVRSDLYSLGCTLYFMLTGKPPYPGGTMLQKLLNHGNAPPPDPADLRPEVSEDLTAIIHKLLAKSPAARYQRAVDLVADLRELAIREGLPRAQSQGAVAFSSDELSHGGLATHLPWLVAASLLIFGAVILQVMASLRGEAFTLEPPANHVTMRPWNSETAGAAATGPLPDPASGDVEAIETEPPRFRDLALPPDTSTNEARSPAAAGPDEKIEKIVIGTRDSPQAAEAHSLSEALSLAEELEVSLIEIAEPVIESLPVRIPRDDITIRARSGQCEIRFLTGQTPAMQRPVMVDVGSHRVEFRNIHFSWNVRSASIDGGTLFALSDNRRVRLSDCTITIENLTQRDEVFAFEITAPADGRESTGVPIDPLSLLNSPLVAPLSGAERATLPQRPANSPLVALELDNVAARGEMTLVNLVDPMQFEFRWENGLLISSRRMLEVAGANVPASAAGNRIRLALNRVTIRTAEGLVRTRLGASGAYPLWIDRNSSRSVFHSSHLAPHIEFTGLETVSAETEQLIQLRGEDNAYDHEPEDEDDWPILSLTRDTGEKQVYWMSQMSGTGRPAWFTERTPQWIVRWSEPPDFSLPPSQMTAHDFYQDGVVASGFTRRELPDFPDNAAEIKRPEEAD